jgi:GNAT superfamily N-acetyltransferase
MSVALESDEDIEGHGGIFRPQGRSFAAVRIGYLAVHRSLQGRGIGPVLMAHAIRAFGNVAMETGICALTLTAISEKRARWYEENWQFRRYGKPCDRPKLFFPAKAAIDLIDQVPSP